MIRSLFLCAVIACVSAQNKDFKIVFTNTGEPSGIQVYWVGNAVGTGVVVPEDGSETFVANVGLNEKTAHLSKIGDSFVLRGPATKTDAGFRARVQVQAGAIHDGKEFPYKLVFQAIAREAQAGPIELKHRGTKGAEFIWIEAGHFIAHYTQDNNPFELRDKSSKPQMSVVLFSVKNEL
jgi:hypothetical protein